MKNNYVDVWNNLHKNFELKDKNIVDSWLEEFDDIISNTNTDIIDLGCGVTGNNTLYLLEKGKNVISCDFAEEAINRIKTIKGSKTLLFDMLEKFPFEDNFTEIVIADLSLHYFRKEDTIRIISEIRRVLKPNGYLFLRVNSTSCMEYKKIIESNVEEIEPNLFYASNMEKRFFDEDDIKEYFKDFEMICINEESMGRYNTDKIIWKCALQNIKYRK